MAVTNCLGLAKDKVREELNEAIKKKLDEIGASPNDFRASVAIRELTEEALQQKKQQKRQEGLRVLALKSLIDRMNSHDDPARALMGVYAPDAKGDRQFSTIEIRADSLMAENNALLPTLTKVRPKIFRLGGGIDRTYNHDIMKAGLGQKTPNKIANQIAKEMQESISALVDQYNAAGGTIRKLDGWFLPQTWNRDKVARLTEDQFVQELMSKHPDTGEPILDFSRMKDFATGKPLSPEEVDNVLRYVYDSITTDGLNKWTDVKVGAPGSMAKRRDVARVLHFTPEGWMHINTKYGNDDTLNNFLNYRQRLIHDIAIMQLLGPNPDWAFGKAMILLEKKIGKPFSEDLHGIVTTKQQLEYLHNSALGHTAPVHSHKLQQIDQASRAGTMAVLLQGAFIPSQADWSHQALANVIQGTKMLDRISGYLKYMANNENAVEDALTDMIVADTILSNAASTSRFDNLATRGNQFFNERAVWTLEKSGLIAHTDAGRLAGINAHRRAWGRDLGKSFDELSDVRKAELTTYGITPQQWAVISATAPEVLPGYGGKAKILSFKNLRDTDPELFRRVHELILQEGKRSVISTDARAEARLDAYNEGLRDNTPWKHVKMFKRFTFAGVGSLESMLRNKNLSAGTRTKALGAYVITGISIGALVLQAKQIIQGKDPLPMLTEDGLPEYRFWIAATLYAGVLPFIGDVVLDGMFGLSDTEKFGTEVKSWWNISPVLAVGAKTGKELIADPVKELFNGDTEKAMDELVQGGINLGKLGAGLFGANHWAFKSAISNFIWEPLEEALAPEAYETKWKRRENYAEERGQGFWWTPDYIRAPELREKN